MQIAPAKSAPLLTLGNLQLQLLSAAPYSGHDPVQAHTLGLSLQRQTGVHAIASDRRVDFDTWPGVLAYTPPGVEVFSESPSGGEYLRLSWRDASTARPTVSHRVTAHGQRQAMRIGLNLRRGLLAREPDPLALEQLALSFIALSRIPLAQESPRAEVSCAGCLDLIASEFATPLSLAGLAAAMGMTTLSFLRAFTRQLGMTPHAYIVETRLQAARRMLAQERADLAEIAAACGFSQQSHMSAVFRRWLGVTPGQYRRRQQ